MVGDRYRVERVIGRGGMGVVFEAVHTWTERRVALKVLLPQMAEDRETVARFLQEAKAAASLRNRHVVDVLDMGCSADGAIYLALELLEGAPFSELLHRGPISPEVGLAVVLPILEALAAAHSRGIVHRDLKPANIFVARTESGQWRPKLLDFGIAKLAERSELATGTGVILGTPRYMAPEQARGQPVGPRADVWSIATILFQCFTGESPFAYDNPVHLLVRLVSEDAPSIATIAPDLHPSLVQVIDRGLMREPDARWPDATAFGEALSKAVAEAGIAPTLAGLVLQTQQPDPTVAPHATTMATGSSPSSSVPMPGQASPARLMRNVTVVRPYGPTIRGKVFPLFANAGLTIRPTDVIPPKTTDEEAVRLVCASDNVVLLVPYHGHRDADGKQVDGLAFVRALYASSTRFRWKIIMPVSAFARASVTLSFGVNKVPDDPRRHVLLVHDDELEEQGITQRIIRHVEEVTGRLGTATP